MAYWVNAMVSTLSYTRSNMNDLHPMLHDDTHPIAERINGRFINHPAAGGGTGRSW